MRINGGKAIAKPAKPAKPTKSTKPAASPEPVMASQLKAPCGCGHTVAVTCRAGDEQAVRDDMAHRLCPSCEEGVEAFQKHLRRVKDAPAVPKSRSQLWLPGDPL